MAKNVLEQVRALDQQRSKLMESAKTEALAAVEAAIGELNSLGFNYRLTGGSKGSRRGTRQTKDVECPICKFRTSPPHDGRAHRGQDTKRPFGAKELEERGLRRL